MISKELLSAVLNKNVNRIITDLKIICYSIRSDVKKSEIVAYYDGVWNVLNIHELSNMVKEWARNKHMITIRSGYAEHGAWSNFAHNNISFCSMDIPFTEPEVVSKAGEWILKEISK